MPHRRRFRFRVTIAVFRSTSRVSSFVPERQWTFRSLRAFESLGALWTFTLWWSFLGWCFGQSFWRQRPRFFLIEIIAGLSCVIFVRVAFAWPWLVPLRQNGSELHAHAPCKRMLNEFPPDDFQRGSCSNAGWLWARCPASCWHTVVTSVDAT